MKSFIVRFILIVFTIFNVIADQYEGQYPKRIKELDNTDNILLIEHNYYSLSMRLLYNVADWSIYYIDKNRIQDNVIRKNNFRRDPLYINITKEDYYRSGYDKGHLVPCDDMQFNSVAMEESFYMTNMTPQIHSFNGGIWKKIEQSSEEWAKTYDRTWIISGAIIDDVPNKKYINNKIYIPNYFYKIFFAYTNEGGIATKAYLVPHGYFKSDISAFLVSIDEIEILTGLNFFSELDDYIEDIIESNR